MTFYDPFTSEFQSASNQSGVPVNILEAVGQYESGFNPGALGSSGEIGIMQLMPNIVSSYGVTNPYDPSQSISAGAALLAQDFAQTGNWNSALQKYNSGSPTGSPTYANNVLGIASSLGGGTIGGVATGSGTSITGATGASAPGSTCNKTGIFGPLECWLDNIASSTIWVIVGLIVVTMGLYIFAKDQGAIPDTVHVPVPVPV